MPLVEIAHDDPRPGDGGRVADEAREQVDLLAALAQRQAEVTVEDVERPAVGVEIDAQARARLAGAVAQVARAPAEHGQAAEDGVAVGAVAVRADDAHHERHAQPLREVRRLIPVRRAVLANDLLEPDDVGSDLGDDGGDANEVEAAIEPAPSMDVVAGDDELPHAGPVTSRAAMKCP
jgi:hypothetical protein